jgi:hypothetical protein
MLITRIILFIRQLINFSVIKTTRLEQGNSNVRVIRQDWI